MDGTRGFNTVSPRGQVLSFGEDLGEAKFALVIDERKNDGRKKKQ